LETSQILLQADQRASNFYGLMNTYDQMGQLYLSAVITQTLAAFQKGWNAKQLNYQQTYFAQQISQLTK